jgi:hypothetical protein
MAAFRANASSARRRCCPRFAFVAAEVGPAPQESPSMDRLVADRERLGPVNLVAADELAEAETRHGTSIAEQAELTEAVHRLRGSIGNLNREGRERLRAAFEAVDGHFRRLFSRLFEGGQAHLALVDSATIRWKRAGNLRPAAGQAAAIADAAVGRRAGADRVALIFALFLTNPAPICVLDEVDAPLDDANIERFCDLLDAMVTRDRDPLPDRHPQRRDDEPHAPPVRRNHGRTRHLAPGQRRSGGGGGTAGGGVVIGSYASNFGDARAFTAMLAAQGLQAEFRKAFFGCATIACGSKPA